MAQTVAKITVHVVFSTSKRRPCLTPEVWEALAPYLAATIKAIDCQPIKIGGYTDHAHMLFALSKTRSASDVVSHAKSNSSRFLKSQSPFLRDFGWQSGYAVMAVSNSHLPVVTQYILNQEAHPAKETFAGELRRILTRKTSLSMINISLNEIAKFCRPSGLCPNWLLRTRPRGLR